MTTAAVGSAAASTASGGGGLSWQRLGSLAGRLRANCAALATRSPELARRLEGLRPATEYVIAAEGDRLILARLDGRTAHVVPSRLEPEAARQVAAKLCPTGRYHEPVLVAGVDRGWLWHFLYQLPTDVPTCPGYKAPMYFLVRELEELWVAAHIHDWRAFLADPRVQLLVGPDAYAQVGRAIDANPLMNVPRLSITLDGALWPAGKNLDTLIAEALGGLNVRYNAAAATFEAAYAANIDAAIAARLRGGGKLRVLGLTARFTTFLQHSMRDWLAAFDAMGHETRLIIERADHEQLNSLVVAETVAEFRPDLILMIDHYRRELGGMPENCPAVMWVQDKLPNIFSEAGGRGQGPMDYCLGFGRLLLSEKFGYPARRYMEATVGVNEARFLPRGSGDPERGRFVCDVSYVSHASTPAEVLLQRQLEKADTPESKRLLTDMFERLRAVYDAGGMVYHLLHFRKILAESMAATGLTVAADSRDGILDLFTHQINNALFRHQALHWLADLDVDIHLYGQGWEAHPRFKRYARGVADNERQLTTIFQGSRINLQITPHGAVHQRLFEGLASGGLFLIRHSAGEVIERVYRPIWDWCQAEGIRSDEELVARATPEVRAGLDELRRLLGFGAFEFGFPFIEVLRLSADRGFTGSAGAIWPEYDQVAFDSRAELHERVDRYLADEEERARIAASMRDQVLERFTYRRTSERLIEFIANDLSRRGEAKTH